MRAAALIVALALAAACSSSSGAPAGSPQGDGGGSSSGSSGGSSGGDGGSGSDSGGGADAPSGDDGGSTGGPTAQQACATLASAVCSKLATCSAFALSVTYGDEPTCIARASLGCVLTFGASGTSATPARTVACAQSLPALDCAALASGQLGAACEPAAGTVPVAGACGDDTQCASTFCPRAATSACGTCALATKAGDPCVNGSCSAGTVCPQGQSTCIVPVAGKVGDPCTSQEQCDLSHAVGCDTASGKCITLTLATAGGKCGADSIAVTSYAVCPASGSCSAVINGTCSAAAADGQACSTATTGPQCMPPAKCIGGKCAVPDPSTCH